MNHETFSMIAGIFYQDPDRQGPDNISVRTAKTAESALKELREQVSAQLEGPAKAFFQNVSAAWNSVGDGYTNIDVASAKEVVKAIGDARGPVGRESLAVAVAAAFFVETQSRVEFNHPSVYGAEIPTYQQFEIQSYATWKIVGELAHANGKGLLGELASSRDGLLRDIALAKVTVEGLVGTSNTTSEKIRNMQQQTVSIADDVKTQLDLLKDFAPRLEGLEQSLAEKEGALDAYKNAVEEKLKQHWAAKLWQGRATRNRIGFFTSLAAIIALAALPLLMLYFDSDALLAFIKKINEQMAPSTVGNDGATYLFLLAVNRLLIIGAPVALYAWIIRIVVRYNTHCLAMMDDANQRRTIMDTFIQLIKDQVVTSEERVRLLDALFRPAPGTSSDSNDLQPITEAISKLTAK